MYGEAVLSGVVAPAPVCLIAFRRPEHTQKVLDTLAQNDLASDTEVYAFVDGPRKDTDVPLIARTVDVIESAKGFKSVTLVQRGENWGLARSVTTAVTEVVKKHGRVIVLEDDIVVSPAFLRYMNKCLDYYEDNTRVWHVSGFSNDYQEKMKGAYAWRLMNCWGWATWDDRWAHFEKNTDHLIQTFTKDMIHRFNIDGFENFWLQVLGNRSGALNTWAIYWYAAIFRRGGLCVSPWHSYVRNIGFDGSGENCGFNEKAEVLLLNCDVDPPLPIVGIENKWAVKRYQLSLVEEHCKRKNKIDDVKKVQEAISDVLEEIA